MTGKRSRRNEERAEKLKKRGKKDLEKERNSKRERERKNSGRYFIRVRKLPTKKNYRKQ